MASVTFYSVYVIIAVVSTVSAESEGICQACNCQFNNIEVLNQMIKTEIATGELATACIIR